MTDRTNGVSDQQAGVIDKALKPPKDPQARDQARQQRRWERLHVLETRFQPEPRVTPWSTATAAANTQVLAREELQQTHVVDMACRAMLCRLEVTHPDLQAVDDFAHLFPRELAEVLPRMHYDHEQLHDGSIRMVIVAKRLTARAIREGRNIEAIVTEILKAERWRHGFRDDG